MALIDWVICKLLGSPEKKDTKRPVEPATSGRNPGPLITTGLERICHVAGAPHHIGGKESVHMSVFSKGQRLVAVRERSNPHDHDAIALRILTGQKVGYVPRTENRAHAMHMDAGGRLDIEVIAVNYNDPWHGVSILIRNA